MKTIFVLIPVFFCVSCFGQDCQINAYDAYKYANRTKTVCGIVTGIRTPHHPKGDTVFIAMGGASPNNKFTAVVPGKKMSKFKEGFDKYLNKNIAVTGKVRTFRGKAEIIVSDPSKIKFVEIKEN